MFFSFSFFFKYALDSLNLYAKRHKQRPGSRKAKKTDKIDRFGRICDTHPVIVTAISTAHTTKNSRNSVSKIVGKFCGSENFA